MGTRRFTLEFRQESVQQQAEPTPADPSDMLES